MHTPSPLLAGKVAVILGGSGAIGSAAAREFASAGARVAVVAARDSAKAEQVSLALDGEGHRAYAATIEDTAALEDLATCVLSDMGGADILVNSAGMTRPVPHADLDALTDEIFDHVMAVNCRGAFAAVRAFAPLLKRNGDGLVVNISSIAATTAVGSSIAYCAAKAGMDVMGAALARALAPAIRVLTVSPGVVDTDFVPGRDRAWSDKAAAATPLKRLASAEDVARAVLACAVHLPFSTGSVIQVDGGRHL
ncbi:MAG TPA: SDR family oxidoreductase [Caulobacteraceae bacterium]|jgi:3-oxoacyl-[acyl-carrier protein] reductase|nr:SDR family oxidoreductase [Caulobacteraceae bacterium]